MSNGEFKNSKKTIKKNILPPFSDNGWGVASNVKDVFINGYEVSLVTTKKFGALEYVIPLRYSGRKLSLSVEKMIGDNIQIQFGWRNGSAWTWMYTRSGDKKIENVDIPLNVEEIRFKAQSNVDGDNRMYLKNLQLEEGGVPTTFEDFFKVNSSAIDKKEVIGKNLIPDSSKEFISSAREFLKLVDLQPIFEKYGVNRKYSLSLDIKSANTTNKDTINVYMQNGNGTKYELLYKPVKVTTEYQRFKFEGLTPILSKPDEKGAWLALYGTYDTGNLPIARNIQLEFGDIATDYEEYKGTQVNEKIGKGLRFDGTSQYIIKEKASIDEFEIDFVKYAHRNSYDTFASIGTQVADQPFYWLYTYHDNLVRYQLTDKATGKLMSFTAGAYELGKRTKLRLKHSSNKAELFINDKLSISSLGEFYGIEESDNKNLSVMTYNDSTSHTTNGTLYSFKGWKNGKLVIHYDFENKPNYKDIAIDHSGNGNDGKIRNATEQPNIKPRMPIYKYPFKEYPFNFERSSVEILDGVQYGSNKPRTHNGGVLVEDTATNLFEYPFLDNVKNETKGTSSVVQEAFNVNGVPMRGVTLRQGNASDIISMLLPHNPNPKSSQVTFSAWVKCDVLSPLKVQVTCVVNGVKYWLSTNGLTWSSSGTAETGAFFESYSNLGNWQRVSFTLPQFPTGSLTELKIGGFYRLRSDFTVSLANIQLEEGIVATSFTSGFRPLEKLDIPVYIDGKGGSIEFEFEGEHVHANKQYLFDSNNGRWLLWSSESSNVYQLYTHNLARLTFSSSVFASGKNKVKVVWTETTSEVWVNGFKVGSGAHSGGANANIIQVGRRYTDDGVYNATFYSFVVKDRNGRITFKF